MSYQTASVDTAPREPLVELGDPFREDIPKHYPLPPRSTKKNVLPEDLKTPDSHVERDPRLIRLTGVHPFNVEPPLSDLYNDGFLTSEDLHYVRNHGPVPKCDDDEMLGWEFTVGGLVEEPITMSVRDLLADYEQATYPITLVCAGNRRKEQNMVRKSKGFSWGAAGLSTALWTGVPIGELLARARPRRGARYVCFEGADKLPNGYYGTSLKLNWCMDPNKGILVAHKMNGEKLHPDHGKPVRIIVPGQIGGRSVKWLKRIIVTSEPSDNWYHIYDNRVLPTMVTPGASADMPDTWKDEKYAIYDLNANSAICYPAHDETAPLSGGLSTYNVRGYAYGGGGKRITRVEVTLDKGKTWRLAKIRYPEDDYRLAPDGDTLYGGRVDMWWRETSFCWCFWSLDLNLQELGEAADIMVRAMDEGMMIQPRDMYWSVLGMMNNPWFRVVIHKEAHALRFEHPTQPALMPGGWMERVKKAGGDLSNGFWGERMGGDHGAPVEPEPEKEICMMNPKIQRTITLAELREHGDETAPWFVVNGEVYDGTPFLEGHPGGAASIFGAAAQDASEEFIAIHSENAKAMMPDYHIGTLDEASRASLAKGDAAEEEPDSSRAVFLQPKSWTKAILEQKNRVSADSFVFVFRLDHENQTIGLPTGQHLMVRLRDPATRETIIRAYTPLSEASEKGKLRVLIKVYYDTPDRKGGKMTQALDSLPPGHFVEFKGPVGKFEYLGRGQCRVSGSMRHIRRFVMVCGGSGITPIFQVLRAVMQDAQDQTECVVLDGNRDEQDILCRAELDSMAEANRNKCRLLYTLSQPGPDWRGRKGRMDKSLFASEVGPPRNPEGHDEMVLICGPEPMERTVKEVFLEMGWADDDLLFF
ncbi:Nitrate reductase [NADPH]-like protein [Hapsidospora chrysogenum ATCC 11550]|uniref:Nitrate reductase n=1 Tax=Hapsidospora chrysogenum (strain ATCC 11550 / CBS 779.69 / DSM 880 / IAM 14645 / JCM 23072 / IMI 49137) TaxID=857340 RepID=A0A086T5E8_HAPC1|nr:Nitrate reductase [NADPH]-like protein [Hapsidospora chrysogenum ATCC 11550]